MTARLLLASVLLVCAIGGVAHADADTNTLSLAEVEASVERAFPILVAARADQDIADAELRSARGGFDPALRSRLDLGVFGYYVNQRLDTYIEAPTPLWGTTFYGGYRLGVGKIPDYDGKYQTNSEGEVRAGAKIPLLRDGYTDRRRVAIGKASLGIEIASLAVKQQRIELLRAARQRYWEWVAAGLRVEIAEGLLRVATERDAVVAGRVARGDLPAVERIENARAIAQRESQLAAARRTLQQSTIELSLYVRDTDGNPVLVSSDHRMAQLPEPEAHATWTDDLNVVMDRRPEPRRFTLMQRQGDLELKLARNQVLPALDVMFWVSKDFGDGTASRVPVQGDFSVVLDVPLLLRQQLGRIDASRAMLRRVDAQLRYARDRVSADLRDATSAITAATDRFTATRKERTLARDLERLEKQRFELGDATLFMVNLREQATIEAALREVDALADYHKAVAAYQAAAAR